MNAKRMRTIAAVGCAVFALSIAIHAVAQRTKTKPDKSPAASVSQVIGVDSHITINYHRPGVREREGEIYGTNIVPYDGDPMPWRAGANETTTIEFENNVKIEGESLPAGKYGFHIIPSDDDWILVFNKTAKAWGSSTYKPDQDALRVTAKPESADFQEWLIYTFDDLTETSAVVQLRWENKQVRFKVEIDQGDE